MRPSRRRFSAQLKVEALESRWCPTLTLTQAALNEGIGISIFAVDFPVQGNKSPYGVAFPSSGGVLVSDDPGNVRLFPSDVDGQSASRFPPSQNYGTGNAVGMASVGGKVYMTQAQLGQVVQLNDDGTLNHVVVGGKQYADGIVANPANGHLFVATQGGNQILDVDPIAQTSTVFATIMSVGLALSHDGGTLFTTQFGSNSHVIGFNTTTGAQVFDSGLIAGAAIGIVQGTGQLAGNLFVNTNQGTVLQVNLTTREQTLIASGGSRGDLMTLDPNDGSALVTQTDSLVRLSFGNPAATSGFVVTGFPATTAGTVNAFTVTAKDRFGNTTPAYRGTIHFTSTDGQAILPQNYTFTANDNGTHAFGAVLKTAGTQTLTATDTGTATITGAQSGIAVSPAATSTFVVSGFATPTTAGTSGTFTVTAKDPYGNTTPAYRGTAHFTSSDQQAQLPADYPFTAADNGIHTFTATLKTAGSQTITATDTAISGAQAGISINPAAAQTLLVAEFPAQLTAGDIGGFLVTALDPYGNVATGYRGTVTFGSSDPQATLPSDYTFTAGDNGSHPFGAILVTAGTETITATDTADPTISGTQAGITVSPAAEASFYVAAPDTAVAGEPFDFTLYALDAYGNVATGYTGTVSFYSNSDPQAILPADYTFTPDDAGIVTFPAGAIFFAQGAQDLSVYDTTTGINGVAYVNVIPGGSPLTRMRGFAVDWLFDPSHKKATTSVLDQLI